MSETRIESGVTATAAGLVARIERRLDQSRRFGRDVDALFRQLDAALVGSWDPAAPDALVLAARAFVGAALWGERAEHPTRSVRVSAELALTHLYHALQAAGDAAAEHAGMLLSAWSHASTTPRDIVADVILAAASKRTLEALDGAAFRDVHHKKHSVSGVFEAVGSNRGGNASVREYNILRALIRSRIGDLEGALEVLDAEPFSDARIPLAYASVYLENGKIAEAVERLQRCLAVTPERTTVREWLVDCLVATGAIDDAIEQLLTLLHETVDVAYWEIICDILVDSDPARLAEIREQLAAESPALHVEVLIAHGDASEVAKASSAKTFSYEQLWRIGDFLAQAGSRKAARVYERAINLHGAIAQSKVECADLGSRVEAVIPYFESIERPTKPARLAKELLARNKNNVPLRREFERVFGARLR